MRPARRSGAGSLPVSAAVRRTAGAARLAEREARTQAELDRLDDAEFYEERVSIMVANGASEGLAKRIAHERVHELRKRRAELRRGSR